jgi:type IV secretory pathway VirB9-like protein
MIYLPKGEEILAYSLGDNEAFQVNTFQDTIPNLVNIKSLYSGVDTNLLVVTKSGKNYSFYLRSYSIKSKELPDFIIYIKSPEGMATFQFTDEKLNKTIDLSNPKRKPPIKSSAYQKRLELLKDLQKDSDYLKELKDPYDININYKMNGDKEIAPLGVYDDGKWTYFDFRKDFVSNRLPVIYKVIDDYDSVVNTRVENGFLITESLSNEGWTLKNGTKTICIKPLDNLFELYAPKEEEKIEEYKKPQETKVSFWKRIKYFFVKGEPKKEVDKKEINENKSSK